MTRRGFSILAAFVISGALWLTAAAGLALGIGYIGRAIGGLV